MADFNTGLSAEQLIKALNAVQTINNEEPDENHNVDINVVAADVSYDNTDSNLEAENAQDAIDEVVEKIEQTNTVVEGKANTSDVTGLQAQVASNTSNISTINTTTTSLQNQINNIVTPVTVDAEVQNARIGSDSTSYASLKDRLDSENTSLKEDLAYQTDKIGLKTVRFHMNASGEHSSTKDKIIRPIHSGDKINISVTADTEFDSEKGYTVYGYSGSTGTIISNGTINGSEKILTVNADYDSIGLYISSLGTAANLLFAVEFEDSIYTQIKSIASSVSKIDTVVQKNIVGMNIDVFYPVDFSSGTTFTMSTGNGQPLENNNALRLYDENKQYISAWNFVSGMTTRTCTITDQPARYVNWKYASDIPLQVEYGDTATSYQEYFISYQETLEKIDGIEASAEYAAHSAENLSETVLSQATKTAYVIDDVISGEGFSAITAVESQDGITSTELIVSSKNVLEITRGTTTSHGVTFTVNDDGTITTSGTADADVNFRFTLDNTKYFAPNNVGVRMSGMPSGATTDTYMFYNATTGNKWGYDASGIIVNWGANTARYLANMCIRVASGTNVNGLVWKPMVEIYTAGTAFPPSSPNPVFEKHYGSRTLHTFDSSVTQASVNWGKIAVTKKCRYIFCNDGTTTANYYSFVEDISQKVISNSEKMNEYGLYIEALNGLFRVQMSEFSPELGGLANGVPSTNTKRFRTRDYIFTNGTGTIININPSLGFGVHTYDENKAFISDSGWLYTDRYTIPSNAVYIKIVVTLNPVTDFTDEMIAEYSEDISIYKVKDDAKYIDSDTLIAQSFNSVYHKSQIDWKVKCGEYSSLMNDSEASESFLFFTDPHFFTRDDEIWEKRMPEFMAQIQKYYNSTPTSFVLSGGDWLTAQDSANTAKFRLGYMDGVMKSLFDRYYPLFGNHDDDYQGADEDGGQAASITSPLDKQTVVKLMFKNFGKAYYSFNGMSTKFYVFDSGNDWQTAMNEYRWEQVAWFAESLLSEEDVHIAIAVHRAFNSSAAVTANTLTDITDNIAKVAQAYNNRTSVTMNGETYDFSEATGKVEFIIAGHTHADSVNTCYGIPVICTINAMASTSYPSFDLVYADYDNSTINLVRVGSGENRTVTY